MLNIRYRIDLHLSISGLPQLQSCSLQFLLLLLLLLFIIIFIITRVCFTVFFCLFAFCQRFFDNQRADSRQSLHAGVLWIWMCLLPFWGLSAPGGGKRGKWNFRYYRSQWEIFALWWFLSDISATRGRIHTKFYKCRDNVCRRAPSPSGVHRREWRVCVSSTDALVILLFLLLLFLRITRDNFRPTYYRAVNYRLPWRRGCSRSRNRSVWKRDRASTTTGGWSRHPGRRESRPRRASRRYCTAATPARRQTTGRWPSTPHPGRLRAPPREPIAHSPPSALCPAAN